MFFGLRNAPITFQFQSIMNSIFVMEVCVNIL